MKSKTKTDCCSTKLSHSPCPECNEPKQSVGILTIKHWLVASLVPLVGDGPFYFCDTKECDVVYFSGDHSIQYTKDQIRDRIASKETSGPFTLCYCFGVSREIISGEILETGKSNFSEWITQEIGKGYCVCEARNPAGRCCLAAVKKAEKDFLKKQEEMK